MSSADAMVTDTTHNKVDGVSEEHHATPVAAAAATAAAESGGKPDPGLQFLRKITLTPKEEQEYTRQAKAYVPGAGQRVEWASRYYKYSEPMIYQIMESSDERTGIGRGVHDCPLDFVRFS